MLKAMDAPSREECTAQRPRSNTPAAALVLLNDPTFVEAARVFASRIIQQGGDTAATRLDFAFRKALSRKPDTGEHHLLEALLAEAHRDFTEHPGSAVDLLSTGIAPIAGHIEPVELASWTAVARVILNLAETITRN